MMISPETYYEMHLSGKTKEEILTAIRGLKQEMGRLKNSMENTYGAIKPVMNPSEDIQLWFARQYLEIAKQAYSDAGGTYVLSKSEERVAHFNANIDNIKKIRFGIGGYPTGFRNYVVLFTDQISAYTEKLWYDKETITMYDDDKGKPFTKETFIEKLKTMHIGEWHRRYSPERFGHRILDGTQWELEIEYHNGQRPVNFYRSNDYPYNFEELEKLFEKYEVEDS